MKITINQPEPPNPTLTLELTEQEAQVIYGLLRGEEWHKVARETGMGGEQVNYGLVFPLVRAMEDAGFEDLFR